MFDHMEVTEYIYEGVVETSLKSRAYSNCFSKIRTTREEFYSSKTKPKKGRTGKRKTRYENRPSGKLISHCMIHGQVYS